jgi:uracil-DNA glycosylase
MSNLPCPNCNGTSFIFSKGKSAQCPRCSGKGFIPGPSDHRPIMIIGEAWGAEEARLGMPFVGASGNELDRILEEAEIEKKDCYLTTVFNLQPYPKNDVLNLCTEKGNSSVPMPPMSKGKYLQNQYFPEVERLWQEIAKVKPNIIVALGNAAMWAVTGQYGIKSQRGTIMPSTFGPEGVKVLPSYNPSMILRDWASRPILVADLMKVKRQSRFPEIRRPARTLWIEPSLKDIEYFYQQHILSAEIISFDIETVPGQITCIGFAVNETLAIVIPFVDHRKPDASYWPTAHQERMAWDWVRKYLQSTPEKVGQNTLYDINWLWHKVGMTPVNYCRDTMLKHHAINPEFEKGLGFLGSIYTDEPAWKIMRGKGFGTIKRGE